MVVDVNGKLSTVVDWVDVALMAGFSVVAASCVVVGCVVFTVLVASVFGVAGARANVVVGRCAVVGLGAWGDGAANHYPLPNDCYFGNAFHLLTTDPVQLAPSK